MTHVFGHNSVGMPGTVMLYMLHGFIESVDNFQRHHGRQVLREIVCIRGGFYPRQDLSGTFISPDLHAGFLIHGPEARQHLLCDRSGHQQAFHGTAGAVTLCFGVIGDGHRFLNVRFSVDVDVADPVQVLDDRHPCLLADPLDQAFAPPRYDDIDQLIEGQQFAHRGPVGSFHNLYGVFRQPGSLQTVADAFCDGPVGIDCLGTASQDHRVARFYAESCGISRDVGPGLVNDPHHAQRHTHLPHLDSGRAVIHA